MMHESLGSVANRCDVMDEQYHEHSVMTGCRYYVYRDDESLGFVEMHKKKKEDNNIGYFQPDRNQLRDLDVESESNRQKALVVKEDITWETINCAKERACNEGRIQKRMESIPEADPLPDVSSAASRRIFFEQQMKKSYPKSNRARSLCSLNWNVPGMRHGRVFSLEDCLQLSSMGISTPAPGKNA
ncbi:unnamed protein product [Thelazia callipaeda]|uniref:Uncharacterized protein n=1 Tax=Thelazia callipaeda TaxID=103827 RepID=A0A0N5CSI1_THECL|nr:unnamed protein product [Thelazia callipaeda]